MKKLMIYSSGLTSVLPGVVPLFAVALITATLLTTDDSTVFGWLDHLLLLILN